MKQYYPKRDRGVYRAAANPNSPIHGWGLDLVTSLKNKGISGLLKWCYRNSGDFSMSDLVYKDNPFLAMFEKSKDWVGEYIPIPFYTIKYGDGDES